MKIRAQAGAKVFFFGEYSALLGGPAALLSFAPPYIFEAEFKAGLEFQVRGVHADSPTSRYLALQFAEGNLPPGEYQIEASKQSLGLRGFGSSTVEYLTALALEQELTKKHMMSDTGLSPNFMISGSKSPSSIKLKRDALETFRKLAGGHQQLPSGYDLLAQNAGGLQAIQEFNLDSAKSSELSSLLGSHLIGIFHTGRKLATHDAIRNLDSASLEKIKMSAQKCWQTISNPREFWVAMNDFTSELQDCGWTQSECTEVLKKLRQDPRVHFAKACGAMGADSILVVLKTSEKSSFVFYDFEDPELGLQFVGSNEKLSPLFLFERLA